MLRLALGPFFLVERTQHLTYDNNTQQVTGDTPGSTDQSTLDIALPTHVPVGEISIDQQLLLYGANIFRGL